MKRFQNILVVLAGTDGDLPTLRWARRVVEAAGTQTVDVLLVDPEPAAWVPEFPEGAGEPSGTEEARTSAEDVAEIFHGVGSTAVNMDVGVGAVLPTVLRRLLDHEYDLVVVGERDEEDRSLAERLTRKSPASVLFVPQHAPDHCRSILTATDFSAPSRLALELAAVWARTFEAEQLACLHTYQVPTRRSVTGLKREVFEKWYQDAAGQHLEEFLRHPETPQAPFTPVVRQAGIPSIGLLAEARERDADFIVIATRGRNAVARALMGSNTADVLRQSPVPVLAVRSKGEGLGVLKSLLTDGAEPQSAT